MLGTGVLITTAGTISAGVICYQRYGPKRNHTDLNNRRKNGKTGKKSEFPAPSSKKPRGRAQVRTHGWNSPELLYGKTPWSFEECHSARDCVEKLWVEVGGSSVPIRVYNETPTVEGASLSAKEEEVAEDLCETISDMQYRLTGSFTVSTTHNFSASRYQRKKNNEMDNRYLKLISKAMGHNSPVVGHITRDRTKNSSRVKVFGSGDSSTVSSRLSSPNDVVSNFIDVTSEKSKISSRIAPNTTLISAKEALLSQLVDVRIAEVSYSEDPVHSDHFLLYILADGSMIFGGPPADYSRDEESDETSSVGSTIASQSFTDEGDLPLFYRIHDGMGLLLSTSHLPEIIANPDRFVRSSGYYIFPRSCCYVLHRMMYEENEYTKRFVDEQAFVYGRVDTRAVVCMTTVGRVARTGYLEGVSLLWSGTGSLEFESGLDFVGSTLVNILR